MILIVSRIFIIGFFMRIAPRPSPSYATLLERYPLTRSGSSKNTYHLSLGIEEGALPFQCGDSVAIYPQNRLEDILTLLDSVEVDCKTIALPTGDEVSPLEYLVNYVDIEQLSLSILSCKDKKGDLPLQGRFPENGIAREYLKEHDLLSFLKAHSDLRLLLSHLVTFLKPMLPRFYSIASSAQRSRRSIDLLVAEHGYEKGGKKKTGTATRYLFEGVDVGERFIPLYLQPAKTFNLPKDPQADLIMVGPGTGVAPFRAFLEERLLRKDEGANWLFFGERQREYDFFYENFFQGLVDKDFLKLSLAFSRDQEQKIYVQDRLRECAKEIYERLERGAFFFVCGDAKNMAKGVERALLDIFQQEGKGDERFARDKVKQLRLELRYLRDVY